MCFLTSSVFPISDLRFFINGWCVLKEKTRNLATFFESVTTDPSSLRTSSLHGHFRSFIQPRLCTLNELVSVLSNGKKYAVQSIRLTCSSVLVPLNFAYHQLSSRKPYETSLFLSEVVLLQRVVMDR